MGDGGPEPYRLWWTLLQVGGIKARVLDGGLAAWKRAGEALAAGPGSARETGEVTLSGAPQQNLMFSQLQALQGQHSALQLLDTRSADEFTGQEQNKKAQRAGRIPRAKHLLWTEALKP